MSSSPHSSSDLPEPPEHDDDLTIDQKLRQLVARGNQELKNVTQRLSTPVQVAATQKEAELANKESAVDSYNAAIDAIEHFLESYGKRGGAVTGSAEAESTASSVASLQHDGEVMGVVDETVVAMLHEAFKAQPLLLKAIDADFARQVVKDVEEQLIQLRTEVITSFGSYALNTDIPISP